MRSCSNHSASHKDSLGQKVDRAYNLGGKSGYDNDNCSLPLRFGTFVSVQNGQHLLRNHSGGSSKGLPRTQSGLVGQSG